MLTPCTVPGEVSMKRNRKAAELEGAPENATMQSFNPMTSAPMDMMMPNSTMASQSQSFMLNQGQLSTSVSSQGQPPTSLPSQGQLSTSMPNPSQMSTSMPSQGHLSMPNQGHLSMPNQGQLPTTSGLQLPMSGDSSYSFAKHPRMDMGDFSDPVDDILNNFDPMQQERMLSHLLEAAASRGTDIFPSTSGLPSSSHGDRSRTMPVRPMVRGGGSSRVTDALPDMDPNLYPFPPYEQDNKTSARHLISMGSTAQPTADQNLALMAASMYHDLDRRRAKTSSNDLNQPSTSATVTRPHNLAEIKPERQPTPEGDAPSTTTPTASTSGNSGNIYAMSTGHASPSDSDSPSSSKEDAHASGVSSTNGASNTSGGKNLKKGKSVPDEEKDESYWEKRKKNNESAKRSREARRSKELQINYQVLLLERENLALKTEVDMIQRDCEQMEAQLHQIRDIKVGRYTREQMMNAQQGSGRHVYDYSAVPPAHQGPPPPPPPGSMHI